MRHLLREAGRTDVTVASAGTEGYHVGEPPDARSVATAKAKGVDISRQRAQQVVSRYFEEYDVILALDTGHYHALLKRAPEHLKGRIHLFLDYAGLPAPHDVPDPYYGEQEDFDIAYRLVEDGCRRILARL